MNVDLEAGVKRGRGVDVDLERSWSCRGGGGVEEDGEKWMLNQR